MKLCWIDFVLLNGKYCRQNEDLTVGSPTSSILAETLVFRTYHNTTHYSTVQKNLAYFTYVDTLIIQYRTYHYIKYNQTVITFIPVLPLS
jgi:hypothetical protein